MAIKNILIKNFLAFMETDDLKDSRRKEIKVRLPDGSVAVIVLDIRKKKSPLLKLIKND